MSATIEGPRTMFKPRFDLRSPLGATPRTARLAWRVALLIVLAAAIFSGRLSRDPAETALKSAAPQATTATDEDDLAW
jgi:hypothetical protein